MSALESACLEVCGHPDQVGACQRLAQWCGLNVSSIQTIEAMTGYLRRFVVEETAQVYDFRNAAGALVRAQIGLRELREAASYANGVTGWRGRMAYALLHAAECVVMAAIHLLLRGEDRAVREALRLGMSAVIGALYEGITHADSPSRYDLSSMRMPKPRR